MDTSDRASVFSESNALLRGESLRLNELSPQSLVDAVKQVYQDPLTLEVTNLFKQIGDLMGDDYYFPRGTKRGLTDFDKGLGVKTFVKACEISSQDWGGAVIAKEDAPPIYNVKKFMLLLKPREPFKGIRWALWTVECRRVPIPEQKRKKYGLLGWERVLVSSEVTHMSHQETVAWFGQKPQIAFRFFDIAIGVQFFAEEQMELAHKLSRHAGFLQSVWDRIRKD